MALFGLTNTLVTNEDMQGNITRYRVYVYAFVTIVFHQDEGDGAFLWRVVQQQSSQL